VIKAGRVPPPEIYTLVLGDLPVNGLTVPIFIVETLKTGMI
jgi:hypothetical protein